MFKLTVRSIGSKKTGFHSDGGGLYLKVTPSGTRSWVYRYRPTRTQPGLPTKLVDIGLGSCSAVSLQEARELALQRRKNLLRAKYPAHFFPETIITEADAVAPVRLTWGEAVNIYISTIRAEWKSTPRNADETLSEEIGDQELQWRQSLKDYGPKADLNIIDIDTNVVMACLSRIWTTKNETATRVRGRIERVIDWAKVAGHRGGENPARWKGHLDKLLPRPSKVKKVKHHAAMPFVHVPSLMAELAKRDTRSAKGMQFTILTAARTEEVIGSGWREFDLERKLWILPPERMKGNREHVVPLSAAAAALLSSLPRNEPPFAMSENTMLFYLQQDMEQPYTVHGFRSSFRDWASETTDFAGEVVEMCLAHKIKDKAEAAYRRGKLIEKRRDVMEAWAAYLKTIPPIERLPTLPGN